MQKNRCLTRPKDTELQSSSSTALTADVRDPTPHKVPSTLQAETLTSKLWLVDLAGSERLSKSHASGERLREAQHINLSLSSLADCIAARCRNAKHVPFRNSKLTHLLQVRMFN